MTKEEREGMLLDFAERAMGELIPSFGDQVEAKRHVLAHKAFLVAQAMVEAYTNGTDDTGRYRGFR